MIIELCKLFPYDDKCLDRYFKHIFIQRRDEELYLKSALAQYYLWNQRNGKKNSRRNGDVHQRIFACLYALQSSGQEDRYTALEGALERLGIYQDPEVSDAILSVLSILLANANLEPVEVKECVIFLFNTR
jgi:hypothetical protein